MDGRREEGDAEPPLWKNQRKAQRGGRGPENTQTTAEEDRRFQQKKSYFIWPFRVIKINKSKSNLLWAPLLSSPLPLGLLPHSSTLSVLPHKYLLSCLSLCTTKHVTHTLYITIDRMNVFAIQKCEEVIKVTAVMTALMQV